MSSDVLRGARMILSTRLLLLFAMELHSVTLSLFVYKKTEYSIGRKRTGYIPKLTESPLNLNLSKVWVTVGTLSRLPTPHLSNRLLAALQSTRNHKPKLGT